MIESMPADSSDAYFNNPREDVLQYLTGSPRKVLDLGCATGGFGAAIKERTGAIVHGIELFADAAEIAGGRLDQVWCGDAVDCLNALPGGQYDLVTANDVLEHLTWPGGALREVHRVLMPGGTLLASFPNFRYWLTFRRVLWDGEFDYEEAGIMDKTHFRFFTRKSIPKFLAANGFKQIAIHGIHPTKSRLVSGLNLLTKGRFEDCWCLQYVVIAERMPEVPSGNPALI